MNTVKTDKGRQASPAYRGYRERAFTLIELLATVTIVGLLTAILVPSVGKMRSSARAAKCVANLRNMAPAFANYAAENGGCYPLSHNLTTNPDNNWWYALAPYRGLTVSKDWNSVKRICAPDAPFGCPETDVNDKSYPEPWISYEMTRAHRSWMAANGGWQVSGPGIPVVRIPNPSKSILVAEGHGNPDFSAWTDDKSKARSGLVYPHNGRTNVLMADGHVESYTMDDLKDNWSQLYTPTTDK